MLHVERIVFDEFSARLYVFAHQGGEDRLALGYVFQPYLQESAALGIHGGFPELLGGHFSEAFVALDYVLLTALVQDVVEKLAGGVFLHDLGLFRSSFGRWLAGFLLGLLGFFAFSGTQALFFIIVVVALVVFVLVGCLRLRRSCQALDYERRLRELLDVLELWGLLAGIRD